MTAVGADVTVCRLPTRHLCKRRCLNLLPQPLGNGWRSRHSLFHKLKPCAAQLVSGGYKIARVGPHGGTAHGHHSRARRPVEARNPFSSLPSCWHILAVMRVSAWENEGCKMLAFHHTAQLLNAFCYNISHKEWCFCKIHITKLRFLRNNNKLNSK